LPGRIRTNVFARGSRKAMRDKQTKRNASKTLPVRRGVTVVGN
jgi:hypothetical protein